MKYDCECFYLSGAADVPGVLVWGVFCPPGNYLLKDDRGIITTPKYMNQAERDDFRAKFKEKP